MKRKTALEVISALLILLFTYAAVSKLLDYNLFRFQLGKSPFLTHVAGIIAWALPIAELVLVGLLINSTTRLLGLYFSFSLMLFFTGYIYSILHFSDHIPCSCGGIISKMSWNQHLIFNLIIIAINLIGILLYTAPDKYLLQKKQKQLI